jgi:hypothetical protein
MINKYISLFGFFYRLGLYLHGVDLLHLFFDDLVHHPMPLDQNLLVKIV